MPWMIVALLTRCPYIPDRADRSSCRRASTPPWGSARPCTYLLLMRRPVRRPRRPSPGRRQRRPTAPRRRSAPTTWALVGRRSNEVPTSLVALEDQPQSDEGEVGLVVGDRLRLGHDDRREPAGGDRPAVTGPISATIRRTSPSTWPAKPYRMPDCSALDGVLADRPSAAGPARPCAAARPARRARRREISMPGASAPPRNSPARGHDVEVGRGAEVDDDRTGRRTRWCAARVLTMRSAPTSFGLSVSTGTPVLDARLDDHGRHVAVVARQHLAQLAQHRRHRRAQRRCR